MLRYSLLTAGLMLGASALAAPAGDLPLMPWPAKVERPTTQGALVSMITGAVVAFAWGQSPMKSVLYEMVPGFFSALLVAILVSLVTYKQNDAIDEEFDRAVELVKTK